MSVDRISTYLNFKLMVLLFFAIIFSLNTKVYASNKMLTKGNDLTFFKIPMVKFMPFLIAIK